MQATASGQRAAMLTHDTLLTAVHPPVGSASHVGGSLPPQPRSQI